MNLENLKRIIRVVKVIHWELCKKFQFAHKTNGICTTGEWDTNSSGILMYHLISARQPNFIIISQREHADLWTLLFWLTKEYNKKGTENKVKYLDLARELQKRWNMKMRFLQIVICVLGTVTEGLLKRLKNLEIKGRVESIQTNTLLRSVGNLWRVLESCCHSRYSWYEKLSSSKQY